MLKELIAANLDLYMDQGDSYYKTFTIRDNNGTIINLTGLTISVSMKRYYNTSTQYNLVGTISDAPNGVIALSMSAAATAILKHDRYVYAITLSDGTDTTKILAGQVLVTSL